MEIRDLGRVQRERGTRVTVQAIETWYAGVRFRSRLEARWAVAFDHLGIAWQYEPQGFVVRGGDPTDSWAYLPDFYLPKTETWLEVKGTLCDLPVDYYHMLVSAVALDGLPGVCNSLCSTGGLLWLGEIPDHRTVLRGTPLHVILQHNQAGPILAGGWCMPCRLGRDGPTVVGRPEGAHFAALDADAEETVRTYLMEHAYCGWHDPDHPAGRDLIDAYQAARSARFERGGGALLCPGRNGASNGRCDS
jgi:hypothetical protein